MQPENLPFFLTALLAIPALGMVAIAVMEEKMARPLAIAFGAAMVVCSLFLWSSFKPLQVTSPVPIYQFVQNVKWISAPVPVSYHVGIDGMSLCLVVLTTFVTLMAILASDTITMRPKLYYSFVMLLVLSILGVFVSLDLLQFFIFYELELVPMYFLIAIWGGPRRDYAAMKFLIYTFFGGVCMLASLLYLYFQLSVDDPSTTFDMVALALRCPLLPKVMQGFGFLGFFLAFIIKLPSFPFHTWLPDAHVEAPTPISMILAGLLLKMGTYGLVRVCMSFFPNVMVEYAPWIMFLGAFNIIWGAVACLVQTDMKRIIAYSSVSHMGFVTLGIGALTTAALNGAIFQMISHGVISAALFFLVGTVYERCHTRQLGEIGGGLAKQMPYLFYFWMFATMANLGLPGLSGFVGEMTIYYGSYLSPLTTMPGPEGLAKASVIFATLGAVLTASYMLWLLRRLFYGEELPKWKGHLSDARPTEKIIAYALCVSIFVLGIFPMILVGQFDLMAKSMVNIIQTKLSS